MGSSALSNLIQSLGHPKILVVGDIMLDRYIFGFPERISQEAPVPVLCVNHHEDRLGGAASVATMLSRLEAEVVLAGVLGGDASAQEVQQLLRRWGLSDHLILTDAERPTTRKDRIIGRAQDRHPQQMMRVDYETRAPLPTLLEMRLLEGIDDEVPRCGIVLVSDYGKGVCTPQVLRRIIERAQACGRRVVVDPLLGTDYGRYRGVSCLTPNRTETQAATGQTITTHEEAMAAGEQLLQQTSAEAVIVTLDREGMALVHADGRRKLFPTRPRQVYDVTGAGDMVLTLLGLCLATGVDYESAIALGNIAAGLAVEQLGVVTVSRADLFREVNTPDLRYAKIVDLGMLGEYLVRRRRQRQKVIFTNGCFDVLHAGHIDCLWQARALGDVLVVGLNSDASVRRLKGPGRPLNGADARMAVLASLACVDYVVLFEEETPLSLLQAIRPDILVKGGDYRPDQIVGREIVEGLGGQVVVVPLVPGQSTTRLAPYVMQGRSRVDVPMDTD